jgi:type IV pilus assembly protein PilC
MTRFLRIILATIGVLFCTFVLAAMAINVPVLFFILSPLFFCIIVGLVFYATGSASRRRAIVVLSYLEQAVRLNLPLPAMLSAAAASEPPGTASSLRNLRDDLESGASIASALRQSTPAVGRRVTGLIDSAERLGQLPKTLRRIVHEIRHRRLDDAIDISFLKTYPPVLAAAILSITSMFMIFVMPKYKTIFADFHTDLPGTTKFLLLISDWFTDDYGWLILLLIVITATFLLTTWLSKPNCFTRSRDWADVCRVMADSLEAGLPLDVALRAASELTIAPSVRRRLDRWADDVQQGQSPPDAARAAGMPPLITGMTTTGLAATNMADVFRFLSRYYAGKFSRLAILLQGAAVPATAIAFGAIVAFVALSLFTPMIALINSVSHYKGAL